MGGLLNLRAFAAAAVVLLVSGCATYRPPAAPAGQEPRADSCAIAAKAEADRLPAERRAAAVKARGGNEALVTTAEVLGMLDPLKLAILPFALPFMLVKAQQAHDADYQRSYEACMAEPDAATVEPK